MHRRLAPCVLIVLTLVGCHKKSPTEPSGGGGSTAIHGQTVSAIDGGVVPNLSVQVGTRSTNSDSNGFFDVDPGNEGTFRALVKGGAVVDRDTRITVPKTDLRISMIPTAFDLDAFNEMFRTSNSRLQRWTARPSLVLLATVMEYRTGAGDTYDASGEQLTDDEVNMMLAHLNEGLALLTGNTYTGFASVEIERPTSGQRVNVQRAGKIVVGRYNGIITFARTIGYGQWSEMSDGSINGGAMFLDRDFDRNETRRRLLRIHELGHALGYQHVQSRTSIMNPSIGPEPTAFDREGAMIAFHRPVGNRTPDVDPVSSALSMVAGEGKWSAPTICR